MVPTDPGEDPAKVLVGTCSRLLFMGDMFPCKREPVGVTGEPALHPKSRRHRKARANRSLAAFFHDLGMARQHN